MLPECTGANYHTQIPYFPISGGLVILNMLNYFHTGLDEITTGRKIQSIASP